MRASKTIRKAGFTLVEIMIVVAIIGLLCAIAVPSFLHARARSQQNACINNLRQIDSAINEWALENREWPRFQLISSLTPTAVFPVVLLAALTPPIRSARFRRWVVRSAP